jgi:catechol 2,3-dioxygenase-like lactoylglutathione lyase family enzyme
MLRGFATINYWTDDMETAKRRYAELLGVEPYFERPGPDGRLAYAEFPRSCAEPSGDRSHDCTDGHVKEPAHHAGGGPPGGHRHRPDGNVPELLHDR